MRIWTAEQRKNIIHQYTIEGKTLQEIAIQYKAKGDTISKYLNMWGINTTKQKSRSKNRTVRHDYFHTIDTPNKAYFLGLLFTDGSITPDKDKCRNPQVGIELAEYDSGIIERLREDLCSKSTLYINKRKNRQFATVSFGIRSAQLAEDLAVWGIVPNKTFVTNHLSIPDDFKTDYMRGLIDGDGSVFTQEDGTFHVNICGHSKEIIQQIAELGCSLIGKSEIKSITCHNNVYRYVWNGKQAVKLAYLLYNTDGYCIERKRDKALQGIAEWCNRHNINMQELSTIPI